jgi:hypothetical protein
VKATTGEFERTIHVSGAELLEMTGKRQYDLFRVYEVSETSGSLRVAEDLRDFGAAVLQSLGQLPAGVRVDSISIDSRSLKFSQAVQLAAPGPAEGETT